MMGGTDDHLGSSTSPGVNAEASAALRCSDRPGRHRDVRGLRSTVPTHREDPYALPSASSIRSTPANQARISSNSSPRANREFTPDAMTCCARAKFLRRVCKLRSLKENRLTCASNTTKSSKHSLSKFSNKSLCFDSRYFLLVLDWETLEPAPHALGRDVRGPVQATGRVQARQLRNMFQGPLRIRCQQ
jgi:hypothetical protein